jgi:hypothetical protein
LASPQSVVYAKRVKVQDKIQTAGRIEMRAALKIVYAGIKVRLS